MLNPLAAAYDWVREQLRDPPGWSKYTMDRDIYTRNRDIIRDPPAGVGADGAFVLLERLYFTKGLERSGKKPDIVYVTSTFLNRNNYSTTTSSGYSIDILSRVRAQTIREQPKSLEESLQDFWTQHTAARDAVVAEYERQHERPKRQQAA